MINRLIIPASGEKPQRDIFARFLAKVAVECMALRTLANAPEQLPKFIDDKQIASLSGYARYGNCCVLWPFTERRIYSPDRLFREDAEDYEVLHEWTFLFTDKGEMYFVMAILGIEYTMNMGGPDVEGYGDWLRENDGRSPLTPVDSRIEVACARCSRLLQMRKAKAYPLQKGRAIQSASRV